MTQTMREPTLRTLGLGTVLELCRGGLPVAADDLVDQVFGPQSDRGSLLISGANGIVGAGKTLQLGSRLEPWDVPIIALDFPSAPDGLGPHYPGLVAAFGKEKSARIMSQVVRFSYDGVRLPSRLGAFRPRFALEAVPEVLEIKKAHYEILRDAFPGIEIRSVTSGFPSSELGVPVAHPAFPHHINKMWEVVEPEPSPITQLFWALGLIPVPVSDHWSFVLDVLFCGVTLSALRYHEAANVPCWKIDKYVRELLGPNPFRAHDAIGARGSNFLTWSCLHHLSQHYGELFTPTALLTERKESGQGWYPPNHFRPLVDWRLEADELEELRTWVMGAVFQMTSLLLHEDRAHLAHLNAIGEHCANFRRGILAELRDIGTDAAIARVEAYHRLHPQAAESAWHPEALARLEQPEGQQLYVNAEHDGHVGVLTLSRESYSWDVDAELNRAIDWLRAAGVERVILSRDFHFATQLVGADVGEFFPGLEDPAKAEEVSRAWSTTARRLQSEFETSVALLTGKRCLGGMLELALHCDYVVAAEDVSLGFPEVTLPVVPGMEGCHLPFRRCAPGHWPRILALLLEGRPLPAAEARGWLIDVAAPLEEALAAAWAIASGGDHGVTKRPLETGPLTGVTDRIGALSETANRGTEAGRKAIAGTVRDACAQPLETALEVQARHSGAFMVTPECRNGQVGAAFRKTKVS